jgi:hypothetical protein
VKNPLKPGNSGQSFPSPRFLTKRESLAVYLERDGSATVYGISSSEGIRRWKTFATHQRGVSWARSAAKRTGGRFQMLLETGDGVYIPAPAPEPRPPLPGSEPSRVEVK